MARPELYLHFGPEMVHAIVILIVEQLNVLRNKAGLPDITKAQVETALKAKFDELTDELNGEGLL